jgi:hypothetical protein
VPPVLSEFQRDLLFGEWWAAEARSRYYSILAGQFSRNNQIITFSSLVLSSGAVGAIAAAPQIFQWMKLGLATATAAVSAFSFVRQYPKRAFDCSDLYHKWAKLAGDCRDLWGDMYEVSALERLKALLDRGPEISKNAAHSIGNYRRLMKKCEDEAEKELKRYTSA